jgi:hypothetical protein
MEIENERNDSDPPINIMGLSTLQAKRFEELKGASGDKSSLQSHNEELK